MPHIHHLGFHLWKVAITVALVFSALLYIRGWVRIRRHEFDSVKGWRAVSFLLGVLFTWLATASPISALDHEMLTMHMVQHLLLMTLVPPLIWLGVPARQLWHGFPQRFVEVSRQLLGSAHVRRLATGITQPAVCWLAASGALIGWHIPSLFAFGMRSEIWHGIEQVSFLVTGLLFWWPVIRQSPSPSSSEWTTLVYLFLATLPCDILSGFLVFCDRVVYSIYSSSPPPFGLSALDDQQCAGALMWTSVTVVYLIASTIFAARLLSPERAAWSRVSKPDPQLSAASDKSARTVEIA